MLLRNHEGEKIHVQYCMYLLTKFARKWIYTVRSHVVQGSAVLGRRTAGCQSSPQQIKADLGSSDPQGPDWGPGRIMTILMPSVVLGQLVQSLGEVGVVRTKFPGVGAEAEVVTVGWGEEEHSPITTSLPHTEGYLGLERQINSTLLLLETWLCFR